MNKRVLSNWRTIGMRVMAACVAPWLSMAIVNSVVFALTKISVSTENNEMVVTSGVENIECSSELVLAQAARLRR